MIEVAGSARRSFIFPADRPTAFAYYSDLERILSHMPHICLAQTYSENRFRMLYSTTELGVYRIRIFVDVQATLDEEGWALRVNPLNGFSPVKAKAGARSSTAQGLFSSKSVFHQKGEQTRIEYSLQIQAQLPTPRGLRFMPGLVVDRIAGSITQWRTREIAEGFIERTIIAFPQAFAVRGARGGLMGDGG